MNHEEHEIQAAAMKALEHDHRFRWLHAIPNGGRRDAITGARLKAEGVKPGVCDLDHPVAIGKYLGLVIEVKTKNGRLTKEQAEYLLFANDEGRAIAICRTSQSIIDTCISYIEGRFEGNEPAIKECYERLNKKCGK